MQARPFDLDPIFRPLSILPGVGPRNLEKLKKLVGGERVIDLLWHLPIDVVDRRSTPEIAAAIPGNIATFKVTVQKHFRPQKKGMPYRVWCSDDTSALNLVFFRAKPEWVEQQLPEGAQKIVSGRLEKFNDGFQIVHPDAIGNFEDLEKIATLEAVYPLTQGITNKFMRKIMATAMGMLPQFSEWQQGALLKREHWCDWATSLKKMHLPQGGSDIAETSKARFRLAYDELLANQLALILVREAQQKSKGRALKTDDALRQRFLKTLPFDLTGAQQKAISEIDGDMSAPYKMLRLLQGDVGSGKTVVAAMTLLNAVANNVQAAIMAPTEILARQHLETLGPWLDQLGISYVCLTGRDKGKKRAEILHKIEGGTAKIIIGTHAIFQDSVIYKDLGAAVIDEQHRFGVHQRLKLSDKGRGVDVLVMTATPIPRTLTLTAYGDMDVSRLDEKPPGRKPVDTRLIENNHLHSMIEGISREIQKETQVYWVCPLVEESELIDLAAAEDRHKMLQQILGDRVGLVHGRMKPDEKDAVMQKFVQKDVLILVATTVIEVGVNVPNATIMVIEHAERFGLSQLHQLRGRVGRGSDQSYCFLIYDGPLGETAKERLSIMRESEDGFVISEKDLELRGAGDVLGTKQSGLPRFRLADLDRDKDLLQMARDEAKYIVQKNMLQADSPRAIPLKTLLYLFERDRAISYLKSG